jgi:hypothetical protein
MRVLDLGSGAGDVASLVAKPLVVLLAQLTARDALTNFASDH